jgi:hypothetical protein
MTKLAFLKLATTFLIASYKSSTLPALTKLNFINKKIWTSPKILIIMGIKALSLIMLMIKRTPFSLKVVNIK